MESNTTFGPGALATPANIITGLRVAMTPVIAVLFLQHGPSWFAAALWVLVSITDGADGWVARKQGTTRSGAFLDPLADKILVFGVFSAIVAKSDTWWLPILIMGSREVWMSYHRAMLARRGISVPARQSGKVKTAFQLAAIMVLLTPDFGIARHLLSVILIWAAVLLALYSGALYLIDGRKVTHR